MGLVIVIMVMMMVLLLAVTHICIQQSVSHSLSVSRKATFSHLREKSHWRRRSKHGFGTAKVASFSYNIGRETPDIVPTLPLPSPASLKQLLAIYGVVSSPSHPAHATQRWPSASLCCEIHSRVGVRVKGCCCRFSPSISKRIFALPSLPFLLSTEEETLVSTGKNICVRNGLSRLFPRAKTCVCGSSSSSYLWNRYSYF